ncbi:MAG: TetR/AcrR family transcriptional regulator [Azoarcus sp.]|jgi:AcrR family transcriptional regulator|nr:TetR/AcrR family transcriptional regulator [Azoarcus sp.]
MAGREGRNHDEIRLRVLDAAEAIAAAQGHAGLSARGIASAAGYTVGTLYLVFKNRDDLILQVNGRTLDRLHDHLLANHPEDPRGGPEEAITALARTYIAYAETESPRWNMLFERVAEDGDPLPEWFRHKRERVFALVEAALRPLARDESEARRAARVLWAGVQGICTLKIRQRMDLTDGQNADEMAAMLIRNFLLGFTAEQRRH